MKKVYDVLYKRNENEGRGVWIKRWGMTLGGSTVMKY